MITLDKKQVLNLQQNKPITSVEQMKNMHNEYNNIYYWSNDFINQLEAVRSGENKNETNDELN